MFFLILQILSLPFVLFCFVFFFFTLWQWSSDQYKMHSADHVHNADTVGMNYRPKQFLNYFSATLYNSNTKLIFKAFYCFLHPRTICIMNYEAVHFSNFILFYFIINYTRRYPATISQHKCWFSITIPMSLSTTILFIFPMFWAYFLEVVRLSLFLKHHWFIFWRPFLLDQMEDRVRFICWHLLFWSNYNKWYVM